jgi:hypothetical protein
MIPPTLLQVSLARQAKPGIETILRYEPIAATVQSKSQGSIVRLESQASKAHLFQFYQPEL